MASENETVEKVLSEIYDAYETWKRSEVASLPTQYLKEWHDRIEAAARRERNATREKSSRVGNAAKMQEALERIRKELILDSCRSPITAFHDIVCEITYSALKESPRRCDAFSKDEVLEMLKDRSFSKEDTIEWLYGKAEGENDGSK